MTAISPLQSIHKKGSFGDHHQKNERDLLKIIHQSFKETEFAITDLSHSRAIIQIK